MSTSGFNPTLVRTSITAVNTAHSDLMNCIGTKMQSNFVAPMGTAWYCNHAQDFFAGFKTAMDDLITKSDSTFQSVVDTMNQAADNWAKGTKTTFAKVPFKNFTKKIEVEGVILENLNDERGIDPSAATSNLSKLTTLATEADSALTKATNAVKNCGFLGGDQAANLVNSLNDIKTKVKEAFGSINSEAKTNIEETIKDYGTIETTNAGSFVAK